MDLVFLSLQGLRISRYPGEDAVLGSHKVGDCTQHRFSSCKGFLLPPHPQVGTPVSRKRFARSYAPLLIVERNTSVGNVPMCSASQTAFSTFSDQLLESANLRKIQIMGEKTGSNTVWMRFSG